MPAPGGDAEQARGFVFAGGAARPSRRSATTAAGFWRNAHRTHLRQRPEGDGGLFPAAGGHARVLTATAGSIPATSATRSAAISSSPDAPRTSSSSTAATSGRRTWSGRWRNWRACGAAMRRPSRSTPHRRRARRGRRGGRASSGDEAKGSCWRATWPARCQRGSGGRFPMLCASSRRLGRSSGKLSRARTKANHLSPFTRPSPPRPESGLAQAGRSHLRPLRRHRTCWRANAASRCDPTKPVAPVTATSLGKRSQAAAGLGA